MLTRRILLTLGAASAALLIAGPPAWAQAGNATAFVRQLGEELVAVVNGPGSVADKRRRLDPLIEQSVDIDAIGRFCLGRFWNIGPQRTLYLPGAWLHPGTNLVTVLDLPPQSPRPELSGLTHPILDAPTPAYAADPEHNKALPADAEFGPALQTKP